MKKVMLLCMMFVFSNIIFAQTTKEKTTKAKAKTEKKVEKAKENQDKKVTKAKEDISKLSEGSQEARGPISSSISGLR